MNNTSVHHQSGFAYLKLFLALSRATHALLDIATPCLAALVWLNTFPPLRVIILGIGTALSGYLAVYALNDVVDYRLDKEKIQKSGLSYSENDLDAVYIRHPMAQGLLSLKEGLLWTMIWAVLALTGAYCLNPACVLIFLISAILEVAYCLMLQVSHLRIIISGVVKTMGGVAAVFAVDSHPSVSFLILLFLWLFFWEVGGQNIPNDLIDVDEDTNLEAKTIPVQLGSEGARRIILVSLTSAVIMSMILFRMKMLPYGYSYIAGAFVAGIYFLLIPGYRLYKLKTRFQAAHLFNRASYYPLAILIIVAVIMLLFGS